MKISTLFIIISLLIAITSCQSGKKQKETSDLASVDKKTSKILNKQYSVADFTLKIAENWESETPANSLRVAQFKLKEHPEFAVVVSYFGRMDNNVDENVERWKNQFSQMDVIENLNLDVEGLMAVKILGTYKRKPFPMAKDFEETPDYGMLAAIVPSSEGPYFLKLTAPQSLIQAQERIFINVLNSYAK